MNTLLIFAVWDVAYYQKLDVPSFDIATLRHCCWNLSFLSRKTLGGKIQGHHVQGKLISGLGYMSRTGSMLPQTIGRPGAKTGGI